MKNVLVVSPFIPYPLISGGHQAVFNGISVLDGIANVYVYYIITESQYKRGVSKQLEQALPFAHLLYDIDPASRHTLKWYWKLFRNWIKALLPVVASTERVNNDIQAPMSFDLQSIPEHTIQSVLKAIKKYNIDIVQVEMMQYIKLIEYLPQNVRSIFVQHEIKFVRDELFLQTKPGFSDVLRKKIVDSKKEEIRLHNCYDFVVTLSPVDTQKLLDAGVNVPIVTSLAVVAPSPKHVDEGDQITKVLTYIGPEYHYPNQDGVMWFLNNCWSFLMAKDANYTMKIIGLWSKKTSIELQEKYAGKVQCVGFVDNLAQILSGTTLIVPLNIGSGIRMKVLEAAQLNVPVVTTSVGVEGLPLQNGVHCFIADDANQFVEDILRLQDRQLRLKFVENTRQTITNKYSLQALQESRRLLYN